MIICLLTPKSVSYPKRAKQNHYLCLQYLLHHGVLHTYHVANHISIALLVPTYNTTNLDLVHYLVSTYSTNTLGDIYSAYTEETTPPYPHPEKIFLFLLFPVFMKYFIYIMVMLHSRKDSSIIMPYASH